MMAAHVQYASQPVHCTVSNHYTCFMLSSQWFMVPMVVDKVNLRKSLT